MVKQFKVAEVFGPTIQGEGPAIGKPVYFVRFGGCDYRCSWCDSMHAVDPDKVALLPAMYSNEIIDQIQHLPIGATDVVLSGGNPLLWDLTAFVTDLSNLGYWIHVETQGTLFRSWLNWVDEIIISPKPPSSGTETDPTVTAKFLQQLDGVSKRRMGAMNISMKYVVFDRIDYTYVLDAVEQLGLEEVFISVGTRPEDTSEDLLERYRQIISMIWERPPAVSTIRVLPQMHVLLWGHKLGV